MCRTVSKTLSAGLKAKCNGLGETPERVRLVTQSQRSSVSVRGPMTAVFSVDGSVSARFMGTKCQPHLMLDPGEGAVPECTKRTVKCAWVGCYL